MMKIIKGLTLMLASAAMALNTACSDLTPVDYSEINPNNFPQNESDVKALVMNCYYPLRGNWWDGLYSPSERGVMFVNDCTTGILTGDFGAQKMAAELNFFPTRDNLVLFYPKHHRLQRWIHQ